jgi:hypothetical protein
MSSGKILTREMLHLPIDVFIEDSDLDWYRARRVADARAPNKRRTHASRVV